MDWKLDEVLAQLPRLRRFKAVQEASVVGNYLRVVTKSGRLNHPKAWLPLAPIAIYIPLAQGVLFMRHPGSWGNVWNKHPTMLKNFRREIMCLGKYQDEYSYARKGGPLVTAAFLISILQTIEKDPQGTIKNPFEIFGFAFWVLVFYLAVLAFAYHFGSH